MVIEGTKWSTVRAAFAGIRTPTIQHEDKKTKEAEVEEEEEEVDGDDLLREKETEYVLEERQLAQLAMLWTALVRSLGVLCLCGRAGPVTPSLPHTRSLFSFPFNLSRLVLNASSQRRNGAGGAARIRSAHRMEPPAGVLPVLTVHVLAIILAALCHSSYRKDIFKDSLEDA